MTRVISKFRRKLLPLACLSMASTSVALSWGQDAPKPADGSAARVSGTTSQQLNSAENLYLQLRTVTLDKARVYRLRDVSIDRAAIHLTLNNGTIAFTGTSRAGLRELFLKGKERYYCLLLTNTSALLWHYSPVRPFWKSGS